jgi:hypothetical protein
MPYAYFGGLAAAAGAAVLFLYGYSLPGALATVIAAALLWLWGVPLLLVPEVAHFRRVRRAMRDSNGLSERILAAAERRWERALTQFAALRPPAALAVRHAEALDALRRRPSRAAGPAAAAAFAVKARAAGRELMRDASALPTGTPGGLDYLRDLRRLWTNAEAASDRGNAQLAVHFDGFVRKVRRLKPPTPMADEHARLVELSERYCATLKQRNAAMASADAAGVQAAMTKLTSMGSEFTQLLHPWYERERLRWYGPD